MKSINNREILNNNFQCQSRPLRHIGYMLKEYIEQNDYLNDLGLMFKVFEKF